MREKLQKLFAKSRDVYDELPRRKLSLYGLGISSLAVLLSVVSIWTILSAAAFIVFSIAAIKALFNDVRVKGLIHYLPSKMRNALLTRSVFDILCDIWFLRRVGGLKRLIIAPFLHEYPPEQAIHYLDDLDTKTRHAMLTKGIINIMPEGLKKLMLPKKEVQQAKNEENLAVEEKSQPETNILTDSSPNRAEVLTTPVSSRRHTISLEKSSSQGQIPAIPELHINKYEPKTEVLLTSSMFYKNQKENSLLIADRWDKLEEFTEAHQKKPVDVVIRTIPKKGNQNKSSLSLVGPLKIVKQLMALQEKLHLTKIENKAIIKALGVSGLLLSMQLLISKRVRCWLKSTFLFAAYGLTVILALGSAGVLSVKYFKKDKSNKKPKLEHYSD